MFLSCLIQAMLASGLQIHALPGLANNRAHLLGDTCVMPE